MTTVVRPEMFSGHTQPITDEEAYAIANYMAVTPSFFADVSCNGDGVLGLQSHCQEECDVDPFNSCARQALWQHLYRIQQEMEAVLGWTLGPRFIEEDIPILQGRHIQTTYGGVDAVNIIPLVTDLVYGPVDYTPVLLSGQTVTLVPATTYYQLQVPRAMLDNPHKAMIRKEDATGDSSNGASILPGQWAAKPQVEKIGADYYWNIFIPGGFVDDPLTDTFSVIHCRLSYFDAPDPSAIDCDGTIYPVYYGTTQKIPIVRQETLITNEIRYWVYTRDMIDPAFADEYVDISSGEFYKFFPQVEFKCFGTAQQLAVVTKRIPLKAGDVGVNDPVYEGDCDGTPCTITEVYACATIIDGRLGIVALEEVDVEIDEETGLPETDESGNVIVTRRTIPSEYEGEPVTVRLAYHTDPYATGVDTRSAVETLRRAIAARTAAEIPLGECGCKVEYGYFAEMSTEMDVTIYTPTGATIVSLSYGKRKGQLVYATAMYTAPRLSKAAIL